MHCAGVALAGIPPGGVVDVITVESGPVAGVRIASQNLRYWLGIPFAAPTSGANAWAAPAPVTPWTSPRNASELPPGCYSIHHNPDTAANQSYDCLNVNVYAPVLPEGVTVPVLVWFYGGAFSEGDNYGPFDIYAGGYMVPSAEIVLVAVNYRLGVMGFLVTDELRGNYGLMDQQAALAWVKRNVGVVGGDPTRVTIWGESAGAMSVGFHLTAPSSRGLFRQAIMDSNVAGFNYKNMSEAAVYGQTFCSLLNCSLSISSCNTSCIRAAAVQDVLHAWNEAAGDVIDFILADWNHILDGFLQFTPVVDNVLVFEEPMAAIQAGNWAQVPLLLGTNSGEGETFIYDAVDFALPGFLINLALDVIFSPEDSKRIVALPRYETNVTDGRVPLSNVITDYWFRCASTQFATAAVAAGQSAYVYRFDHVFSKAFIFPEFGLPKICETAVCHASELPFVFHNDVPSLNATFTPAEAALSATMVTYWTNFVKYGNPNGNSSTPLTWPAWDVTARPNILLNESLATESSADLCAIWDSIGYFW